MGPWMSDGEAKFLMFCATVGIFTVIFGIPTAIIYGVWWAVHHVRFIP